MCILQCRGALNVLKNNGESLVRGVVHRSGNFVSSESFSTGDFLAPGGQVDGMGTVLVALKDVDKTQVPLWHNDC